MILNVLKAVSNLIDQELTQSRAQSFPSHTPCILLFQKENQTSHTEGLRRMMRDGKTQGRINTRSVDNPLELLILILILSIQVSEAQGEETSQMKNGSLQMSQREYKTQTRRKQNDSRPMMLVLSSPGRERRRRSRQILIQRMKQPLLDNPIVQSQISLTSTWLPLRQSSVQAILPVHLV